MNGKLVVYEEEPTFDPGKLTPEELLRFGEKLDEGGSSQHGSTFLMEMAGRLLYVRTRSGDVERLHPNAVQRAFERTRGQRNIVLKARQLGLTTWTAARFFLKTISQPGTLTLQVAHTQDSAEE